MASWNIVDSAVFLNFSLAGASYRGNIFDSRNRHLYEACGVILVFDVPLLKIHDFLYATDFSYFVRKHTVSTLWKHITWICKMLHLDAKNFTRVCKQKYDACSKYHLPPLVCRVSANVWGVCKQVGYMYAKSAHMHPEIAKIVILIVCVAHYICSRLVIVRMRIKRSLGSSNVLACDSIFWLRRGLPHVAIDCFGCSEQMSGVVDCERQENNVFRSKRTKR